MESTLLSKYSVQDGEINVLAKGIDATLTISWSTTKP
jgi:hypothetical protein